MFTTRDVFLSKIEVMDLMMHLPSFDGVMPAPTVLKPVALWTGKQIFSMLLPDLELRRNSAWHDDEGGQMDVDDSSVVIQRGQLLSGAVCKKTLGTSSGGLVHLICLEYGNERAAQFLSHTQYVMNQWLLHRGFSVGIGDMVISQSCKDDITRTLDVAKDTVDKMVRQLHRGEVSTVPGQTQRDSFEAKVNQVLNAARDEGEFCPWWCKSKARAHRIPGGFLG